MTSKPEEMGSEPTECSGPHYSFLGLPVGERAFSNSRAVILPVPYDGTTTYRSGTREGPRAILQASKELEFFDEETCTEAYREGIATLGELEVTVVSPIDMVERVRRAGEFLLKQHKLPVLIGGEHLLSLGMIQALVERCKDLTILHLDAHADLRENYQGSAYSNACVMYQAMQIVPLVQAGIRSLTREENDLIKARNIPCFFAHQLAQEQNRWDEIVHCLGPEVYISIDLDVFDPSCMPAVGTPEPGGMSWWEILALLRRVVMHRKVVGFDVMELLPIPHLVAPDFLAARLIYKLLSYIFLDKKPTDC